MKKLAFILLLTVLCASCATTIPATKETIIIDYSRYQKNTLFFISESNSVSFDYTPIGSVITRTFPKQTVTYYGNKDKNIVNTGEFTIYDALDELVNKSMQKGANGIINVKITGNINSGYTITGMAIKK